MNATSNVSYLAKSTSATSAAAPSFALALYNWLAMVYSPLTAYYLPVVVAFGLVSNALTLLVMLSSAAVAAQTSRTARVYYIALACADEFVLIAQALVRFLGKYCMQEYSVSRINKFCYKYILPFKNSQARLNNTLFMCLKEMVSS